MSELYKDPSAPLEERVNDLVGRMTLEEKIGQLIQSYGGEFSGEEEFCQVIADGKIGSRIVCGSPWAGNGDWHVVKVDEINEHQRHAVEESKLGIPLLFGRDVIHGHRTIAPIPLGQAATWNPELVKEGSAIAANEAYSEGINWTFAPMMDICRDPRWGRVVETLGEDPYLASELAVAMVEGLQGPADNKGGKGKIAACAKHFAGYGYAEGGRDYDCTEINNTTMYNTVLPPFKAAVQRGGCETIMTSFQSIDATPVTASEFLLKDTLRDAWKFDGMVISDWGAIKQIEHHGTTKDEKEAAEKAIVAGVDMEMVNNLYPKYLPELLKENKISIELINHRVGNVLRTKFRMGLFENPYVDPTLKDTALFTQENRDAVRKMAEESIVLAKNNGVLPLTDLKDKKIAVIGPMAHEHRAHLGTWNLSGLEKDTPTLVEAFEELLPESKILAVETQLSDMQILKARDADVIICCVGEGYLRTGEAHALSRYELPPGQEDFINALARFEIPMVVLCATGRPYPIPAAEQNAAALIYMWHAGTEAARAAVNVLKGDCDPGGRFPITVPRHGGQIPIYYGRKHPGKLTDLPGDHVSHCYDDDLFKPLYPFGYGMSYTQFDVSEAKLGKAEIKVGESNSVEVTVKNTGDRKGSTVVQCYIRDPRAQISRPVKELIGFKKVTLAPGSETNIEFPITSEAIGYYNTHGEFLIDEGEIQVGVGLDSTVELDQSFQIV